MKIILNKRQLRKIDRSLKLSGCRSILICGKIITEYQRDLVRKHTGIQCCKLGDEICAAT